MSQEQPPIRSRRELRQARDERLEANQEAGTPGPGAVPPASNDPASNDPAAGTPRPSGDVDPGEPTEAEITGRRRIPGPVDSVRSTAGSERSSQIRARDRATLRTIKELAEKEGNLAGGGPPTRRQLRLMQLAAETAPSTSANLIVPASPRTRATPVVPQPGGESAPAGDITHPGQKADAGQKSDGGQESDGGARAPGGPEGMTVEQALAARELLAQQAQNQLAKMEHINATDPDAVDPAVLAEQIALAERAAVLNRRAAAKQKLAEQNSKPEPVRNDPTTANNLAMVTPLEFVQVPGVERPVMKRPATTYVPVVTNPGPRVEPSRKSGNRRPASSRQRAASASGRGGVLARAEAAAKAASAPQVTSRPAAGTPAAARSEEDFTGRTPVSANSAYGLDPLDAATAGLGRARRLRLVQLVVLALGVLALIAGITLIITGLSG
jgi:ribosomal protein L17